MNSYPTERDSHLEQLAQEIRNWTPGPNADLGRSAADARWAFVSLVEEYMQQASTDAVVAMVLSGAIPRSHDLYGTLICLAARHDLSHLIKPLVNCGCEVNTPDRSGISAAELALKSGASQSDATTLEQLLDAGAERPGGASLLCYAAYCGHAHNVAALLDRGFDPNAACPIEKTTPLVSSFSDPDSKSIQAAIVLLNGGADPNAHTRPIRSSKSIDIPINALARADLSGIPERDIEELLDMMIARGLKIDHDHHDLYHPLDICMRSDEDALARMLLQRGADPKNINSLYRDYMRNFGNGAAATRSGNSTLVKTPLQLFASSKMPRTVQYLIEHLGEDPEQTTSDGTPVVQLAFDPHTRAVIRSAIAQKQIRLAIGVETPAGVDRVMKQTALSL